MDSKQTTKLLRRKITDCQNKRKKLADKWKTNVSYRVGEPFETESEQDRVAVPQDWTRTRAKTAQMFSAVPTVTLTPENPQSAAAVPIFQKEFNHVLTNQAKPHVALEESLSDLINAAGLCAAIVQYEATFRQVDVPSADTSMMPPEQAALVPMVTVPVPVSERFTMRRISPSQLLWDTSFKGSDWNEASVIGYEGSLPWAIAKREFKLDDADKDNIVGAGKPEDLSNEDEDDNEVVTFQKLFYRAAHFDPNELHLNKIRCVVFVDGIPDRPVVDEDYQGQQYNEETGEYIGVCDLYPIQVCTLTYISDRPIPPSDSQVGRPMVDEQMRSRSQMMTQRENSQPMRWMDTNRIDPIVADLMRKGEWQGFIPVIGDGSRAIGEVARAAYPPQNFQFDSTVNKDLDDSWGLSANQFGAYQSGERSAAESKIVAGATSALTGMDRAKVVRYFLNLCTVLGGLMQRFHSLKLATELVGEEAAQRLQAWDMVKKAGKFVYTIRQDSTVLLDSNQRLDQLMRALNLVGKSGYVNVEPIIAEIVSLSGLDPATVMMQPQPQKSEQPNLSLRLSGVEDLTNPIVIAMLLKSGQAPDAKEIQAAKMLLADAAAALQPPQVTSEPVPQGMLPSGPPEDWAAMPRITKRPEELGS